MSDSLPFAKSHKSLPLPPSFREMFATKALFFNNLSRNESNIHSRNVQLFHVHVICRTTTIDIFVNHDEGGRVKNEGAKL